MGLVTLFGEHKKSVSWRRKISESFMPDSVIVFIVVIVYLMIVIDIAIILYFICGSINKKRVSQENSK